MSKGKRQKSEDYVTCKPINCSLNSIKTTKIKLFCIVSTKSTVIFSFIFNLVGVGNQLGHFGECLVDLADDSFTGWAFLVFAGSFQGLA